MTSNEEIFERFIDEDVLTYVGLAGFRERLAEVCTDLDPSRLKYWAAMFALASDAVNVKARHHGLSREEEAGLWYDDMKSLAYRCIEENANCAGRERGGPATATERHGA